MPVKKLSLVFIFYFLVYAYCADAQSFGFEWIKTGQPYYKFSIAADGVYKIDSALLAQSGVNLSGIHPKRFQLFRKGAEVAMYIPGQDDGVLNAADVIEFYAQHNDGLLDRELYQFPQFQPHPWQSMITDTAAYFLTILPDTTVPVKRFVPVFDTTFSAYIPEPYFIDEVKIFPAEKYVDGPDLGSFSEKYNSSEYLDGEGLAAVEIGLGLSNTYLLNTPFKSLTLAAPVPTVDIKIIPISNYSTSNNNHHVQVYVGPDGASFSFVKDLLYKGYAVQQFNATLAASQIGNTQTVFRLDVLTDLNVLSDYNSLSYIRLNYARQYQLGNQASLYFKTANVQPGSKSLVVFQGYGSVAFQAPVFFDLTANKRIRGIYASGAAKALIDNDGQPHQVMLSDSQLIIPVTKLTPVQFPAIDPAQGYDFLLISHPLLANTAAQYRDYRRQRFPKTFLVYTPQLYDYYTYGDMHPLAVRRFAAHLLTLAAEKPKFMLLAGRGFETRLFRSGDQFYTNNLVPAIGVPSSDVMFTNGITGSGFEADIPTGRIAAETDAELGYYLEKLRFYETDHDSIQEWRKQVLHLSGGEDAGEQQKYRSYINANEPLIEGKNFGGQVTSYSKSVSDPTTSGIKEKLLKVQNDGISLLTFMGHGSTTVLDVDIGSITELNNFRKYPFYYFNGCNIGNASDVDPGDKGKIYGRKYVCTQNKGAIGWLAHSNLTIDGNLGAQMAAFYNQFCITNYGSPIGTVVQQACRQFAGADIITKMHNLQLLLQGDPATIIYSPALPDLKISSNDIYLTPGNITALSDSFAVAMIVTNLARATDDSVEISVTRTLPSNKRLTFPVVKYHKIYYKDTVYIWIKGNDPAAIGLNVFEVTIDPANKINESNKLNNVTSISYFIPGTGITDLFPLKYGIVGADTVALTIQNNDLFAQNASYVFELDTGLAFNASSPFYRNSGVITSGAVATWKVVLPHTDTLVYFWRARLNVPENQGGVWNNASFTYISQGKSGWAQSHFDQYKNISSGSTLVLDSSARMIDFADNSNAITTTIARWWHGNLGIYDPYLSNPKAGTCIGSGIVCRLYDKRTLDRLSIPSFPTNCNVDQGGTMYYYYAFDTRTVTGQQDFKRLVDSAEAGTYFAIFSYYDAGIPGWTQDMRNAFAAIGSLKVAAAQSYYTGFTLIGQKGSIIGTAVEDTVFNDSITSQDPNDPRIIAVNRELIGKWYTASMVSEKIGPTTRWGILTHYFRSIEDGGNDRSNVDVIGVKTEGAEDVLFSNVPGIFDLSAINASIYRYLKLRATFTDSVTRTPDQFGRWMVTYQEVPEGTISPAVAYDFYKEKLQQGDSLRFRIGFQNLTGLAFDSLPVEVKITDANRVVQYQSVNTYAPLHAYDSTVIAASIPSVHLSGNNTLQLIVNGNSRTLENMLSNNVWAKNFTVEVDQSNPLMDVTFDGYRIMNGDYVSPTPLIHITSKDDNVYRVQNDTSTFSLFIKRPGSSTFEQVSLGSANVKFIPGTAQNNKAVLEYAPGYLPDGIYSLQVLSKDATGNISGNSAYTIDFNVVGASSITNFFPYPNPCTTNMRFVFTLTGSKAPDDLLIRMMTISGKIVREITKEEFGPIHIGNNISEWAWDGTDIYGDRLANGVYLYQVLTRIDGQSIDKLKTKADKYFIQNTGKIYLMK